MRYSAAFFLFLIQCLKKLRCLVGVKDEFLSGLRNNFKTLPFEIERNKVIKLSKHFKNKTYMIKLTEVNKKKYTSTNLSPFRIENTFMVFSDTSYFRDRENIREEETISKLVASLL